MRRCSPAPPAPSPATAEERAFLEGHGDLAVRATGSYLGHGLEPQFPMNVALAAVALGHGSLFPPCDSTGLERPMSGELQPDPGDRRRPLARRRPRFGRAGRAEGEHKMASTRDKMGRPIVVVTGLGVVTSLGAGKTDNWAKLTAGQSGIRAITRFPTDGLKTRIAGTIDFLAAAALLRRAVGAFRRARRRGSDRRNPASARAGDFPGPLFLAVPPIEIEWPQRLEIGRQIGRQRQGHLYRPAARERVSFPTITSASCSARSPTIWPRSSAPRARRSRCPRPAPRARARSSSASRRSAAAKPTPRSASAPTARSIRKR